MKIDTEELHWLINDMRNKLKTEFEIEKVKDTFVSGKLAGGLHALSDLKIELLQWELQERTKGNK